MLAAPDITLLVEENDCCRGAFGYVQFQFFVRYFHADGKQMVLMTGHSADAELLRKGYPYRKVAKLTNVSESTVKRLKKEFCI